MSRANCVSLVELAESGALKLHRNRFGNSPVASVASRLHEQGIVEQIFEGALTERTLEIGGFWT